MERLSSLQLLIAIMACSKEGNKKMKERAEKILEERAKKQKQEEENKAKN